MGDLSTSPMMYPVRTYSNNEVSGSYREPSPFSIRQVNEKLTAGPAAKIGQGLPSVMLLTVAEPPQQQCELWADVDDLSKVEGWLRHEKECLDGVYLQFQPKMLQPEGAAALKDFSKKYKVGVWGLLGRDPDDYATLQSLVKECGVSYYNTDLPRNFFKSHGTKRHPTPPLMSDHDDDQSQLRCY